MNDVKTCNEAIRQLKGILNEYALIIENRACDFFGLESAISQCCSIIARLTPSNSPYVKLMLEIQAQPRIKNLDAYKHASRLLGVVQGLKKDFENGYLLSIEELIHADTFSDFLESAEELLTSHHYLAAAVIIGSVLENHLKKLSIKNDLPITEIKFDGNEIYLKADRLNSELKKRDVYNKIKQQQITGYLAIRNAAAHGNFDEFNEADVKQLLDGVREFIVNFPA